MIRSINSFSQVPTGTSTSQSVPVPSTGLLGTPNTNTESSNESFTGFVVDTSPVLYSTPTGNQTSGSPQPQQQGIGIDYSNIANTNTARPASEIFQEAFDNAVGQNSLDVLSERLEGALLGDSETVIENLYRIIDFDRIAFPFDWSNTSVDIRKPNITNARRISDLGNIIRGYIAGDTPIVAVADLTPDNTDINTLYTYIYQYNNLLYNWAKRSLDVLEEFQNIDTNTDKWLNYKLKHSSGIINFKNKIDKLYFALENPWSRQIDYALINNIIAQSRNSLPETSEFSDLIREVPRTNLIANLDNTPIITIAPISTIIPNTQTPPAPITQIVSVGYDTVDELFSKALVSANNLRDEWQEWCDAMHIYFSWGVPYELGYRDLRENLEDLPLIWSLGDIDSYNYPATLDVWRNISNNIDQPGNQITTSQTVQIGIAPPPPPRNSGATLSPRPTSGQQSRGISGGIAGIIGSRSGTQSSGVTDGIRSNSQSGNAEFEDTVIRLPSSSSSGDEDIAPPAPDLIVGNVISDLDVFSNFTSIWTENKIQNTANGLAGFTYGLRNLRLSDSLIVQVRNYLIRNVSLLSTIVKNSAGFSSLPNSQATNIFVNQIVQRQFPYNLLGNPITGQLPQLTIRSAPYVSLQGAPAPIAVWDEENTLGRESLVYDSLNENINIDNIKLWSQNLGNRIRDINDSINLVSGNSNTNYEAFSHDISNIVNGHYEFLRTLYTRLINQTSNKTYALLSHWCLIESSRTNAPSASQLSSALSMVTFSKWAGQSASLERYKSILIKEIKNHVGASVGTYSNSSGNDLELLSLLNLGQEQLISKIDVTNEVGSAERGEVLIGESIDELVNYIVGIVRPTYNTIIESGVLQQVGQNSGKSFWLNVDAYMIWHILLQSISSAITYKEMLSLSSVESVGSSSFAPEVITTTNENVFPTVVIRQINRTGDNKLELYYFKNKINTISQLGSVLENVLYDWSDTSLKFANSITGFHFNMYFNISQRVEEVDKYLRDVRTISGSIQENINDTISNIAESIDAGVDIEKYFVKNIFDFNNNAKLLSSVTQTLSVVAESIHDRYLYPDYSAGSKEDFRGCRVAPRYLPDMISALFEAVTGSRLDEQDSDKIIAIGTPYLSTPWRDSPIRELRLKYKSNMQPLELVTNYSFDDGLWCFLNNPISLSAAGNSNLTGDSAARFYADKCTWVYFSNGRLEKHTFEQYLNHFSEQERGKAKLRAYNLLLSESLKIYTRLLYNVDFRDERFAEMRPKMTYSNIIMTELVESLELDNINWNSENNMILGDKSISIPFGKIKKSNLLDNREEFKSISGIRPWDRLYLIPWSPNVWLGNLTNTDQYTEDYIRRSIESNVKIGELSAEWSSPIFRGASRRSI